MYALRHFYDVLTVKKCRYFSFLHKAFVVLSLGIEIHIPTWNRSTVPITELWYIWVRLWREDQIELILLF